MRELRTCDFCGDEPRGTYEIVPPELSPTEAEQRRVVLCDSCRATLSELLEPLLARTRDDESRDDPEPEAGTGPGTPSEGIHDEGSGSAETGAAPGLSADSGAHEPGERERTEIQQRTESESPDAHEPDDGEMTDVEDDGGTGATVDPSAHGSAASSTPKSFGKVLRLLRNRDLPMARSDVEGLAAGAYDLESHQVEAILDRAIERGDLVEDGRQIRLG